MVTRQERLNDPEESLRVAMDGRLARLWTALPAVVTSVNLGAMTISAQPTIQGNQKDDAGNVTLVNMPLCTDVPICFPSAGGYTVTFPVKAGDECLLIFSARAIDAWHQSGGIGKQVESRMHDLSDAFAILGPKSASKVVGGIASDGVQLRNDSGQTFVEINDSGDIKLSSPTKITLDTPIVYVTGQIENISGEHTGSNYDATFLGNIHATGDVTSQTTTISLTNHVHGDVQNGSGETGAPIG